MYYWIYAILYIFLTIIIGQLLIEQNLKLIYYLVMLLLYISFNNIYFSVLYYIKLRNHKGIKGDRGEYGLTGEPGSNGTCVMSTTCGVANCKGLIEDTLATHFTEYKKIQEKIKENVKLDRKEEKILNYMNKYISILMPKCESYDEDNAIENFKLIIEETIKDDN